MIDADIARMYLAGSTIQFRTKNQYLHDENVRQIINWEDICQYKEPLDIHRLNCDDYEFRVKPEPLYITKDVYINLGYNNKPYLIKDDFTTPNARIVFDKNNGIIVSIELL